MPLAAKRKQEKIATPIVAEPAPEPLLEEQEPAPKVTALVFSYDNAPGLRRCLTALENSNDRRIIDILVVDCGSHDESPGMDSEFPNITILRLPRYFGRTKALNIGTRTANSEFLFYLTSEVEVMPTTIPTLLARLENDPEAAAVCPLLMDTQANTPDQFFRLPTPSTGTSLIATPIDKSAEAVPVEYATFQAFLIRKYFVRGINYLDERYGEFGGDAELCWQIRRTAKKTLVLPQVTALYTPLKPSYSTSAQTLLAADCTHGAAVFFGKHYGFLSGLMFRIKSILNALLTLRLSLCVALISGTKIDGSQSTIL
jgi:glycosyltransferase involved in cell wall biosynthesis